jgi:hypothetical protein
MDIEKALAGERAFTSSRGVTPWKPGRTGASFLPRS